MQAIDLPAGPRKGRPRARLLGCLLDALTLEEAVAVIDSSIAVQRPCQHAAINAAKLVRLQHDPALSEAVHNCELITADGQSVVWASRLLGSPLPGRVTGIDLMAALCELAARRGYGVYLLGARPEVIEQAARRLAERFPGLEIVGSRHGYFDPEDEEEIVSEIAEARPELLFVALETPKKEIFLSTYRDRLGVPFTMGVGGAFDVIAGVRRRAPVWLQRIGLEWFYRLAQDPRRLAGRYVVGNSKFVWLVLNEAFGRRAAGAAGAR